MQTFAETKLEYLSDQPLALIGSLTLHLAYFVIESSQSVRFPLYSLDLMSYVSNFLFFSVDFPEKCQTKCLEEKDSSFRSFKFCTINHNR